MFGKAIVRGLFLVVAQVAANRLRRLLPAIAMVLCVVHLLSCPTAIAYAAIYSSGDIDPADPNTWTTSTDGYIGKDSTGAVTVNGGSDLLSRDGYLGYTSGSTGTATVTGSGSTWNSSRLHVGSFGTGTLNIEAGGQVSNSDGYLGFSSGSTGTAAVTGTGSKWTNDWLVVGREGTGRLTVSDGGVVTAETLFASLSDLYGNGAITTTKGAVLDADLIFDATHGLQQTLAFGTGGKLHLNLDVMGSWLGAGYKSNGTLRIADGVTIACSSGYLGYNSGSTGVATVTGTYSRWNNSGDLYIGRSGTGRLTVSEGGVVTAKTLFASLSDLV